MTRPRKRTRHNGEGSLAKRKDGTWEGRYTLGRTPEGKQLRKSVYGRTRAEAADKLKAALATTERGAVHLAQGRRLSLSEYLHVYREQHAPGLAHSTQVRQKALANMVTRHAVGGMPLQDVKVAHLEALYRDLAQTYAAGTVRHLAVYIGMVYRQALRHEIVRASPAASAQRPRGAREEAVGRALEPQELQKALAAMQAFRNYAVIALIALTGLRHGEALGLRWQDVDEAAGTIDVRGTLISGPGGRPTPSHRGKTEGALRTLYLNAPMRRVLAWQRELLEAEGQPTSGAAWIFPTAGGAPMRQSVILQTWRSALKRAGIAYPYRIHDLRHTLLTHLIEGGADPRTVADIAGHSDPSITLRLYTHGRAEVRKAALMQAAVGLDHLVPGGAVGVVEE